MADVFFLGTHNHNSAGFINEEFQGTKLCLVSEGHEAPMKSWTGGVLTHPETAFR